MERADRDALILSHLGLVRRLAKPIHRSAGNFTELGDLIGSGVLGLIEAAERFEPERGISFVTWCQQRVRGAMLDMLRQMSFTPKREGLPKVFPLDLDLPGRSKPVGREIEIADEFEYVMGLLTTQQRKVAKRYYQEEKLMLQIGAEMGISESQVSRIHSKLMNRLRGRA